MVTATPHYTEHRIPTERGRIYVRDYAGDGDAFVLMHGFPDNLHIYDGLIPHLVASGRRVVAFDFAGYGQSERVEGARYGFSQQLEDLEAVVRGLDLGRSIPVGHDASGPAALNFALKHPGKVASVILLNSFYAAGFSNRPPELILFFSTPSLKALKSAVLHEPEQFAWFVRYQQDLFLAALPEPMRPHLSANVRPIIDETLLGERSSTVAFAEMTRQLFAELGGNAARVPALATIKVPVRLIWGEYDPYLRGAAAEDLASRFPDARLTIVPAGHWPQIDRPEDVSRLMIA